MFWKVSAPAAKGVLGLEGLERYFPTEDEAYTWISEEQPRDVWLLLRVEEVSSPAVYLKVTMVFDPTPDELRCGLMQYEPTEEMPEPDAEWLQERCAINRLRHISGVQYLSVVDGEDP